MAKNDLLAEFTKLNCAIDIEALHEYLDFCLSKTLPAKIKNQTSTHHILPKSKCLPFSCYADLKLHPWNAAELTYYDHYHAHYLLVKAVDHHAVLYSFVAMHNKDVKLERIRQEDLIPKEEYDIIFAARNKKISERFRQLIDVNGQQMSLASWYLKQRKPATPEEKRRRSQRMKGSNNIVHKPNVVQKIREVKSSTFIGDKSLDIVSAERAAETMKKPFLTPEGQETTIYKQAAVKHSDTLRKSFIEENGEETTLAIKYGKERSIRMRAKGKWYILKNVFDESLNQKLSAIEVRNVSPGLESCTRENYLGKSKFGASILTKKGKASLIGLFVEKLA